MCSLSAKSSGENRVKSSTDVICKAFSCAILFGPIPFIFVSSVGGLFGSVGGWIGSGGNCWTGLSSVLFMMSFTVSIGWVGGAIPYFRGRAACAEAKKNNPNNSRTIIKAVGIKVTPQNGIIRIARMKQMIPTA